MAPPFCGGASLVLPSSLAQLPSLVPLSYDDASLVPLSLALPSLVQVSCGGGVELMGLVEERPQVSCGDGVELMVLVEERPQASCGDEVGPMVLAELLVEVQLAVEPPTSCGENVLSSPSYLFYLDHSCTSEHFLDLCTQL